ncbi:MAG: DMT family transporter [Alphaproteobacteria bacterium]
MTDPPTTAAAPERKPGLGVLLALAAACCLGLAIAVSRFAYQGGTTGLTLGATRGLFLVVVLGTVLLARGRPLALSWRDWGHCAANGVLMGYVFYANVGAVEFIPIGLAALLFFTYPPIIAALTAFLARRWIGWPKAVAVAIAFAGLSLMLSVSLAEIDWRGAALSLTAALLTAISALWVVRHARHIDTIQFTFHMSIVAAVFLSLLGAGFGALVAPATAVGWLGLVGVVLLQSTGITVYFASLAHIDALKSGMLTNIQPPISIAAAYLLFGEYLEPLQFLGGGMVLAGILLMQWRDFRDTRALAVDQKSA